MGMVVNSWMTNVLLTKWNKIVDTEEYVCHKDHRKCDLKGSSYNDLCQYDCFLSSLSFHTWHQLVRSKLGWFENIKKKKNFVNVVSNTNQMVLFLPAQNLKLWKRTLLPPSAFSLNQSEGMWLVAISTLAWVTILCVLKWIHLSSDTTTSKCYFSESFYTCSIVHPF